MACLVPRRFRRLVQVPSLRNRFLHPCPIDHRPDCVNNVFDAVQFFKDLGGYEKVSCGYTKAGYLPDELLSISPNRTEKTVRKYYFI